MCVSNFASNIFAYFCVDDALFMFTDVSETTGGMCLHSTPVFSLKIPQVLLISDS